MTNFVKGSYQDTYFKQNKYSPENKFAYEGSRHRDYFRDIPFKRLGMLLKKNGVDLNSKTVLVASSGSGIDGYYLAKLYADIKLFFSDINFAGMEKLRSNFQHEPAVLTDNNSLAFKDDSFDYCFIAASLHHLKEPVKGIYELLRVARRGLIVLEPNDSFLTRFFEKIGWAHEYEIEHNNYVYRFSKRDIDKICKALFLKYNIIRFFSTHRIAKTRFEFLALRILNGLSNLICPGIGNYIFFLIKKEPLLPKHMKKQ